MDAVAEKVIGGLSSLALEEFGIIWNLTDDKQKIVSIVSAIKAVLKDAEAKANNHQVSNWLEDLKDVLYDADDLLDDFSTKALRRKLMTGNKIIKKVQIFFSKRNQIAYAFKMGHKMKEIKERLDGIANTRHKLPLQLIDHPVEIPVVYRQRQTYSYVREDEIIGREEERNHLKGYLFDANVTDNVSVISIVGIGGLGKTALAQLVYNDKAVQEYFELTMWVCVSDEFDICKIAQNILGHTQNSVLEQVQQKLRDKVRGTKYLLVLDDVWNEDSELWLKLKHLLMEGGKGSKIIVTTRSNTVARIMGTHLSLILKGLDFERSWKIFCRVAFDEGKEPHNSELVAIGKDIVKKCGGVPLAIRTVGGVLFSRNLGPSDWQYFRDEFSKIEQLQDKINPILKLSYDHLPSCLKTCFAYCSLFPKDYEFDRKILIWLWVDEGFIQPSDDTRCEEDVGHEYFMYLLSISFFQDVTMDDCGEVQWCKMHDLIHDLAQSVAGNEYVVLSEGKEASIEKRTRHLPYNFTSHPNNNLSSSFPKGVKIRTFISHVGSSQVENIQGKSVFGFVLSLKCLRALTLSKSDIEEIPRSIKELKHLRFLRLTYFKQLRKLPLEITSLPNLQTLILFDCPMLKQLPSNFSKLTCLRRLVCYRGDGVDLECMPCGLGELSCLQYLGPFVLGPTISNLTVLSGLINLRTLHISRLKLLRDCAREVEAAKVLLDKGHLQELELWWSESYGSIEDEEPECNDKMILQEAECNDEMILQGLQPRYSIKSLSINGFCGESLPDWMGNLSSLINLEIRECKFLTSLPEGIHNLKSLQNLHIFSCPLLEDRCKRERGEDWRKIAHIPNVDIY